MVNRRWVITAFGVAIAVLAMTASGSAYVFATTENHMTFSGPVALPGVVLTGGTYIFEELIPNSPNVVRVLSKDRSRVYLTAFTTPIQRPARMPASMMVSFGEAPAGAPAPIAAWYPVGTSTGHKFIYDR